MKSQILRNFSKNAGQFCFLFLTCLSITGIYSFFSTQKGKDQIKDPTLTKESLLTQFFNAPLYFEKNEGQIDPNFHYITRCPAHTCCFNSEGMNLFMQSGKNGDALLTLNMRFVGSNPHSLINGIDMQECKSHYFIGNDSNKWQSGISNYAKVSYENIYPGIDVLFYGNAKQLEYDFLVAPGANPHHVRFRLDGAKDLAIDNGGNLQIMLEDQQIVQMKKPSIYQVIEGNKIEIAGEFLLLAKNEIGFSLGRYDSKAQLVIDPILTYSTYLGGSGQDEAFGVTVDGEGYAYVTGRTQSSTFPTTSGAYQTSYPAFSTGTRSAFVTKFNPTGSALIYSTYLGGTSSSVGNSLTVDSDGNVYVVGFTESSDFPVTPGAAQTTYQAQQDAFVTKLNPTGSGLVYSTYLGGAVASNNQQGSDITLDNEGNAYVTGYTQSSTFPVTPGAFQTALLGTRDGFVTQINPEGTQFLYSTYLGGAGGQTVGNGIVLDTDSNVYVTGNTTSDSFPTTTGAFQTAFGGVRDAYVTKLDIGTSTLVYSTYLGGSSLDRGRDIAIDSDDCVYVTGLTQSTNFPTTVGVYQTALVGTQNVFVTKLNPEGSAPIYSTYLGGSASDQGNWIVLDSSNYAYIAGYSTSPNFPVTSNAVQSTIEGTQSTIISKLNPTGSTLTYSTYLGGSASSEEGAYSIALDSNANAYVAGATASTTFPTTSGAFQTVYGGGTYDCYTAKLTIGTPLITAISPNHGPLTGGTVVTITGINFTNATAVQFGSTPAATFTIDSDTQITVVSPSHDLGSVDITVVGVGISPTSSADLFTYQLISTTTTLTALPNPAKVGQTVALTATVSSSSATGSMTFFDGGKLLGVVRLSNGSATFSADSLSIGKHHIIATYSGDNSYLGSSSEVVTLIIKPVHKRPLR